MEERFVELLLEAPTLAVALIMAYLLHRQNERLIAHSESLQVRQHQMLVSLLDRYTSIVSGKILPHPPHGSGLGEVDNLSLDKRQ